MVVWTPRLQENNITHIILKYQRSALTIVAASRTFSLVVVVGPARGAGKDVVVIKKQVQRTNSWREILFLLCFSLFSSIGALERQMSVGLSVCRSVGRSVCLSVCRHFAFSQPFFDLGTWNFHQKFFKNILKTFQIFFSNFFFQNFFFK